MSPSTSMCQTLPWTLDRPLGLGHATPTTMAFLASPLCTDEAWMRGQYAGQSLLWCVPHLHASAF